MKQNEGYQPIGKGTPNLSDLPHDGSGVPPKNITYDMELENITNIIGGLAALIESMQEELKEIQVRLNKLEERAKNNDTTSP